MSPLTRRRLVAAAIATLGAAGLAVSSAGADRTLVVADADSEKRLLEVPVDDGTAVTLSYTHSVERTPVEDVYVVDGTELAMDRTVFRSFGAGLPTDDVERTDEGFVVRGGGRYDELYVAPGSIAGHELVVGERRFDLVSIADGSVVLFLTDRRVGDAVLDRSPEAGASTDRVAAVGSTAMADSTGRAEPTDRAAEVCRDVPASPGGGRATAHADIG